MDIIDCPSQSSRALYSATCFPPLYLNIRILFQVLPNISQLRCRVERSMKKRPSNHMIPPIVFDNPNTQRCVSCFPFRSPFRNIISVPVPFHSYSVQAQPLQDSSSTSSLVCPRVTRPRTSSRHPLHRNVLGTCSLSPIRLHRVCCQTSHTSQETIRSPSSSRAPQEQSTNHCSIPPS